MLAVGKLRGEFTNLCRFFWNLLRISVRRDGVKDGEGASQEGEHERTHSCKKLPFICHSVFNTFQTLLNKGGSPGLVVMGGDSRSKGCEFESWHSILDGHIFTFICCKTCNVFLKK